MITPPGQANLTLTDLHTGALSPGLRVTASQPVALINRMQVDGGAWGVYTRTVTLMANPGQVYLPVITKGSE